MTEPQREEMYRIIFDVSTPPVRGTLTLECRGCGATKASTVNVLPGVTLVAVHPYTCADCNPKNCKGKAPKRFHGSLRNGYHYHTVEIDDRQLGEFLSTLGLAAPVRVTPSEDLLAFKFDDASVPVTTPHVAPR
jgi:hypothetical protein